MKYFYVVVLFSFLFLSASIFPQQDSPGSLISDEPVTSYFNQSAPQLFNNPSGGFWITWKDDRNGLVSQFAQVFDKTSKATGSNFLTFDHSHLVFGNDGSYLNLLKEQIIGNWEMNRPGINIKIRIVQPGKDTSEIITVDSGLLFNSETQIIPQENAYSLFFREDSSATLYKYSTEGVLVKKQSVENISFGGTSTAITGDGHYVIFYKVAQNGEQPDSSLICKAKFYSSSDSLLSNDLLIFNIPFSSPVERLMERLPLIKVLALNDTVFQFIAIDEFGMKIYSRKYDAAGTPLSVEEVLPITGTSDSLSIVNMDLSNITASGYTLIFTLKNILRPNNPTYLYKQYNFNKEGILQEEFSLQKSGPDYTGLFSSGISRDEQGFIYAADQQDNDIYLNKYLDLKSIESTKVNDDIRGDNQVQPGIIPAGNLGYLVVWEDKSGIRGRYVDKNGIANSRIYKLENRSLEFFPDGNILSVWKHANSNDLYSLGFTVYNKDFNIIHKDSVSGINGQDAAITSITFNDGSFVIALSHPNYRGLKLYDKNFQLQKELKDLNIVYTPIYREDASSFWVRKNDIMQLYSSSLDSLRSMPAFSFDWYLKNGIAGSKLDPPPVFGDVIYFEFKSGNDPAKNKAIIISGKNEGMYMKMVNDSIIGCLVDSYTLFLQTYHLNDLSPLKNYAISQPSGSDHKDPVFSVNGNSVLFVWSDSRNKGMGYDIFAKTIDIETLTEVDNSKQDESAIPKDFDLPQNYPNPFNPVTTIEYDLPAESNVHLGVYDMLGRQIQILSNGTEPAGIHKVRFDGAGLSSGVYLYTLRTDKGISLTRKMVIMK